jgi:hypothetical protein
MKNIELYENTSQILLGCEQIFPELELIPRVRYALERLTFHPDKDDEIYEDFFSLLKLLSDATLVSDLEYLVFSNSPTERYYGVVRIVSTLKNSIELTHIKYFLSLVGGNRNLEERRELEQNEREIVLSSLMALVDTTNSPNFKHLRIYMNHLFSGSEEDDLDKILLAYLDDLSGENDFVLSLKSILLEQDSLVKIKKIIRFINYQKSSSSLLNLEKVYEHYVNVGSDEQVWKFLYDETRQNIFNRIKVVRNKELAPRLSESFSKGQVVSKLWAIKELNKIKGVRKKNILLLASWYGLLSRMMFDLLEEEDIHINTVDIDESCFKATKSLNYPEVDNGHYVAYHKDIFELDYEYYTFQNGERVDLIVNTSCEHIEKFDDWYEKIKDGNFVLLQSNNFFDCEEHVNCVESLREFKQMAPMKDLIFSGTMEFEQYSRFMLIGYK